MMGQFGNKVQNADKLVIESTKDALWVRKFDYDEEIFIGSKNDEQYLLEEDE